MTIIKKATIMLFLAISLGANSFVVYAEEAASSAAVVSPNETISHIEKALVEISKSDFNTARVHLKAARLASEKVTGNAATTKEANALIVQAQIKTKLGDIQKSSDDLRKAIELYKTL